MGPRYYHSQREQTQSRGSHSLNTCFVALITRSPSPLARPGIPRALGTGFMTASRMDRLRSVV
jgi:hypothetical protein